ncbi:MAG: tRNA (adenosine(37)-N6)-threonylcarbamoyltransferase complex dimerization subunit type 1 TsaB [bacterium]|nr:tRNA (adenosine(37)-N6)-threonylcarbamoyltransferase complex dimerization subunit type 1 TsaB [bacterium]
MLLIIDTAEANKIRLALCRDSNCSVIDKPTDKGQLEELLPAVDIFLKAQNASPKDLKIIAVNEGPGTYTGLRIGITTANTLAWSLDIPIFGFHDLSNKEIANLAVTQLEKNLHFTKPINPKYPYKI